MNAEKSRREAEGALTVSQQIEVMLPRWKDLKARLTRPTVFVLAVEDTETHQAISFEFIFLPGQNFRATGPISVDSATGEYTIKDLRSFIKKHLREGKRVTFTEKEEEKRSDEELKKQTETIIQQIVDLAVSESAGVTKPVSYIDVLRPKGKSAQRKPDDVENRLVVILQYPRSSRKSLDEHALPKIKELIARQRGIFDEMKEQFRLCREGSSSILSPLFEGDSISVIEVRLQEQVLEEGLDGSQRVTTKTSKIELNKSEILNRNPGSNPESGTGSF